MFRDIFVRNFDFFLEILVPEANHSHIHFPVRPLVVLHSFGFCGVHTGAEKIFHPIEGQLIRNQLFDLGFIQTQRWKYPRSEFVIFVDVESPFIALETGQRFDEFRHLT